MSKKLQTTLYYLFAGESVPFNPGSHIWIPLARAVKSVTVKCSGLSANPRAEKGRMEAVSPIGRTRNLLIVDDDLAQAYLFEQLLSEIGPAHTCQCAASGAQALHFLRRRHPYENAPRPELIILDVHMPGIDGCEVLREIKGDPDLCCIPVIMFSLGGTNEFDDCYRDQANACVQKPVDLDGTVRVVREIEKFWCQTVQLPIPAAS